MKIFQCKCGRLKIFVSDQYDGLLFYCYRCVKDEL